MADAAFDRETDPQQQIRRILGVLRRAWLPIATCLGAGVLVGVALWYFIPKSYVSTAKLVMRSGWMFDVPGEARAMDELPFSARSRQLEDQLKSTKWIEAVLDKLEWPEWSRAKNQDDLERRRFVAKVKEKVTCRVLPGETGERLVFVNFTWKDREQAAHFCEDLTQFWIDTSMDSYKESTDRRVAIGEEALGYKRTELDDARRALEQFEQSHGISAINQRQDTQQRADQLHLQLDKLGADIAGVDAQMDAIDRDLTATNADGTLILPPNLPDTDIITNDQKRAMLEQVVQTLAQITQLKTAGYTEKYRPLQQLDDELRRLIKDASELPNTVTVATKPLPNPDWQLKKTARDELYVQLQGMRATQVKMEVDLQEIQETLQTLPEVLRQHEGFRENVAVKQQIAMQQELDLTPMRDRKQALLRQGAGKMMPYDQIEHPVAAPSPSSAIGWLALAISTMLGLGLAVVVVLGRELLRSSFTNADQARRTLKLPVLGEVAPIQTALEVRRHRFVRSLQVAASLTLLIGMAAAIWICVARPKNLPTSVVQWAQELRDALS